MADDEIENFRWHILKGQEVPDDLRKLFDMEASRVPDENAYADPLEALECRLITPAEVMALLDHAYLGDDCQIDPDTASNIAAIDDIFQYITFVVRDANGAVLGYWHGPEGVPIELSSIVKFDPEGQFRLLPGRSLVEAMLGDHRFEDEKLFAEFRAWFEGRGIAVAATSRDDLPPPVTATRPEQLHRTLCKQYRAAAGLPPVRLH